MYNKTQQAIADLGGTPLVYTDNYPGRPDHELLSRHCPRCGGAGYLEAYRTVNGGICFRCGGENSTWQVTVKEARAEDRAAINSANRDILKTLRAQRAADERRAEWDAEHPGLGEALARLADARPGTFATELRRSLEERGSLSPRQTEITARMVAEHEEKTAAEAARRATAAPVPAGHHEVRGKITSARWVEGGPAWSRSLTLKVTVLDERGFKIYSTLPARIHADAANGSVHSPQSYVGAEVAFTAELTPSDDDEAFGFAKRPSKARVLARA